MIGVIQKTTGVGGYIKADGEFRPLLPFSWADTNFHRNDVGHDTPVKFFVEWVRGRQVALCVTRTDLPK